MWFSWVMLALAFVLILVGCDIFTNSIEWLGKKLDLNEGILGSVFAAVGTALPETLIPIVAVVLGATSSNGVSHANDVGLGAIIGAPFMLATVAMFVTGIAVLIYTARGRRDAITLRVNSRIIARDIRFFLLAFTVAIAMSFFPDIRLRIVVAVSLVAYYIFYVYRHATDASEETGEEAEGAEDLSPLHFSRKNEDPPLWIVVAQVVVGLTVIVGSAWLFVLYVGDVAHDLGITPLILSLIIVPLATELPEKFNSVLWVRRTKDTLALGNITGAMVFQSTLPVSFGMVFTEWRMTAEYIPAFAQALMAIIAASLLYASIVYWKRLRATALILSGTWYLAWIFLVFPIGVQELVTKLGWFQ